MKPYLRPSTLPPLLMTGIFPVTCRFLAFNGFDGIRANHRRSPVMRFLPSNPETMRHLWKARNCPTRRHKRIPMLAHRLQPDHHQLCNRCRKHLPTHPRESNLSAVASVPLLIPTHQSIRTRESGSRNINGRAPTICCTLSYAIATCYSGVLENPTTLSARVNSGLWIGEPVKWSVYYLRHMARSIFSDPGRSFIPKTPGFKGQGFVSMPGCDFCHFEREDST